MTKQMSEAETRKGLAVLSKEFKVPTPKLKWSDTPNGWFWCTDRPWNLPDARVGQKILDAARQLLFGSSLRFTFIELGPMCYSGAEVAMLHEFAHHVQYCQHGWTDAIKTHGPEFCEVLMEVVYAWFGNLWDYPWHQDYPQVYDYVKAKAEAA